MYRKAEWPEFAPEKSKTYNILIIRPEKIGDVFVSFPLIDNLKNNFPQMRFHFICSNDSRSIIENDPRFEEVYLYNKKTFSDLAELKKIRSHKYDCVIDLVCDDSVTSALLTLLTARNAYRIGMGKNKYRKYYHVSYTYRTDDNAHIIDNTLRVLKTFGLDYESSGRYSPPYIGEKSKRLAETFMSEIIKINGNAIIIGINISAGSDSRQWSEDKYKELISRLLKQYGKCEITLICTPSDREYGKRLLGYFKERVHLIPPNLNIREASAIISKFNLLISPDTSLIHIARSFNVAVVGLYCSFMDNYKLWFPFGQKNGVVLSDSENDIKSITVDIIAAEIEIVLSETDKVSSQLNGI